MGQLGPTPQGNGELKIPLGTHVGAALLYVSPRGFLSHHSPTTLGPGRCAWLPAHSVWVGGVQGGWELIERQACGTIVGEGRDLWLVWVTQPCCQALMSRTCGIREGGRGCVNGEQPHACDGRALLPRVGLGPAKGGSKFSWQSSINLGTGDVAFSWPAISLAAISLSSLVLP